MASSLEGGGGGGITTAAAVRAEQIRTLYRQSPWIMAVNPVNAAIVGAVLWSPARAQLIVGWVLATALATALRATLRSRYLRASPPAAQALVWGRRYAAIAALGGLVWGAGSVLLYASDAHASELILVFVIGGMAAGAAGTLAYYLPAFFCFAAPTLLPLAGRIMLEGDRLHLAMGALGLLFGLALATIAINTHRAITEAFRLRFENEDLAARLSRAQVSLEEVNRTLEQRVEERGTALEKQAEVLREARRMESLGLLAGGVAHDFNNLLTVILGNVAGLLADDELTDGARASLAEVRGSADRAATLVSQLLTFSRRQLRRPRVVDLNVVVSDMQRLLSRLIGEHIELVVALQGHPLPVFADPGQLEQVIINLATNARDAMSTGGRLTIETEVLDIGLGGSPLAPAVEPGSYVMLSVRDNGVGMDAETRRLAFHPFFTTKEVGQGTGLGLATVYGIVEQSGGHIFVESEPGRGSSFRVFLPRSELPIAVEAAPTPPPAAPLRHPATVLLVEDERLVRAVVGRALARAGFTVLEADDGEQALERARAHEGTIDLLVTDVVMSRMGGPELAKHLVLDRPGIRVLFVSGYPRNAVLPDADVPHGVDFLQKPFTPEAVVDRSARLLASATAGGSGSGAPRSASGPRGSGLRRL